MRALLALALVACLVLGSTAAGAALKPPRPTAGLGLLEVRPFPAAAPLADTAITFFREPGLGRWLELPAGRVQQLLVPVFGATTTAVLLAVTERRGEWLRVVVDDAGREGWVRRERSWDFTPWEEYLKGRSARLLPGLRKNFYQLLAAPADSGGVITVLAPQTEEFRFIGLQGQWALVLVGQNTTGWLRWCDPDRRFLVTVTPRLAAQKH